MNRIFILVATFFFMAAVSAQEVSFGKKIVDTLTSPNFWGRGYTNDGMSKAADFISTAFKDYGLDPMDGKSYLQGFSYPINTFPGKMEVLINGKKLQPGKDFIVAPESKGLRSSGKLVQKDSVTFVNMEEKFIVHLEK